MREVQFDGHVAEVDALRVQELLVDGVEEGEVVLLDSGPELGRVFFAEEHDCFPGSVAEVVGLFDAVDEEVVQVFAFDVELDELVDGVRGEVEFEFPWQFLVLAFFGGGRDVGGVGWLRWFCARVQVVE